ncbi:hypothetical protein E0Z10_g2703 [Xylaria hypoxylon]|uniref:Uncharacterized protein n=1 Tax=Xylaria hypoxylon TaxID=37992 RepID=A0A4Z0YP48_9PEZI|nr:hypothetical protein E0Z10_g2703 [Xylaria hypoxylon]
MKTEKRIPTTALSDFPSTMSSELRRPPTRTASTGSRPPTSRFQEGSMNDRISAAPPVQFLGPDQLKEFEDQFYMELPTLHEARRQRPFSATAQLQAATTYQYPGGEEPQQQERPQQQQPQQFVTHKKSASFFSRVRDALFHRGGGQHGEALKQQDVRRKHTSLQEPLRHPPPPPPPRPDYMQHAGRSQSEVNIAQMFPNPRGAADRPSREDVMASYNQLVASGFFQSHAIQSTRHAGPKAAPAGGRQTPVLPMDHQTAPRPPVRIPSIHASNRSGSISPMPMAMAMPNPNPQGCNSREYATATMAAPAAPRSSLSSLFRPSIQDLHTKDSWYALRGRKRTRGDCDETPTPEAQSSTAGSAGYFAQPLKRVAKKLREMPSSSSQLNERHSKTSVPTTQQPTHQTAADGVVRLVPSVSSGGSVYPNERPIRLRSPSPAAPEVRTVGDNEPRTFEGPVVHERVSSAAGLRRPRKTFSYTLTESARSRSRNAERERARERERDVHRVQKRDSSSSRPNSRSRTSRPSQPPTQNPLGQWQRVSVEDTIIHRDSDNSARSARERERERGRRNVEERTAKSPNAKTKRTAHSPLTAMPDANRGVPSAQPKAPEPWHGTGKAYHLKDRGSRPELVTRRSDDSGKAEARYGKENDRRSRVDDDGDTDVLVYETRRQPREKRHQQEQQQWHIGKAL